MKQVRLGRSELTVSQLTARSPVSQSRVSTHLKCLTQCGFAAVRRDGRHACYRVSGPHIAQLVEAMRRHGEVHGEAIRACLHCASPAPEANEANGDADASNTRPEPSGHGLPAA